MDYIFGYAQDSSLRKTVRKSMSDLLDHIGTAQTEMAMTI
jgi:hypothetical protein